MAGERYGNLRAVLVVSLLQLVSNRSQPLDGRYSTGKLYDVVVHGSTAIDIAHTSSSSGERLAGSAALIFSLGVMNSRPFSSRRQSPCPHLYAAHASDKCSFFG